MSLQTLKAATKAKQRVISSKPKKETKIMNLTQIGREAWKERKMRNSIDKKKTSSKVAKLSPIALLITYM